MIFQFAFLCLTLFLCTIILLQEPELGDGLLGDGTGGGACVGHAGAHLGRHQRNARGGASAVNQEPAALGIAPQRSACVPRKHRYGPAVGQRPEHQLGVVG
jgi:hypothetical protein